MRETGSQRRLGGNAESFPPRCIECPCSILNVKALIGQSYNTGVCCMPQFENYGHFTALFLKALDRPSSGAQEQ